MKSLSGEVISMKINYTTGCTCDSLTIDGKESIDMPVEDIKEAIVLSLNKVEDIATLQDMLVSALEYAGEFEDLGHCEQCGDFIYSYTLEI